MDDLPPGASLDRLSADEVRRRLAVVEERIDRIGKRLVAGYGSDADRDGWLLWLRQLTAQRAALRGALGPSGDEEEGERGSGAVGEGSAAG